MPEPAFDNPEIFREVLESLQVGVYFVDRDLRILFWNDGAEKITGYLRQEVVGAFCRDQLVASDSHTKAILADTAAGLTEVLREGKPAMMAVSLLHKSGHRIFVRLRAVPIRNSHGSIVGAAETMEEDLTNSDWNRRQDKLASYGCLDPMTGVLGQSLTLTHLRECISIFSEHRIPFSVLMVEIDRIDHLRTTYSAAVIASVMRVVADTLKNSLRPSGFIGRYGAYRFCIILTECSDADVERVAERLRKMVSTSEVQWWGDEWSVTASLGGTTVRHGDTVETVIERAEAAVSESLQGGGNRTSVSFERV
jgi:diguanylate cyclase (GGDEF)-like protein/PAS domain S-box-containing protein